jgi:hypothetical protein
MTHEQGSWITPAFNSGAFSSDIGTWTVSSSISDAFYLKGRTLTVNYNYLGTATGTPSFLRVSNVMWGGYVANQLTYGVVPGITNNCNVATGPAWAVIAQSGTLIQFGTGYANSGGIISAGWTPGGCGVGPNGGQISFEVE